MTERFANLSKLPQEPALRLLALANAKLTARPALPAAAPVPEMLAALEAAGARDDMLRLLAAALPVREAIWWGCLAAGDLVPPGAPVPKPLAAARAWVYSPTPENRDVARLAAEGAEVDTVLAAAACAMCDGKIGPGELAAFDAPPGAVATFVFGLNIHSLSRAPAPLFDAHADMLIDRALDIARGGDGQGVPVPELPKEAVP
jgi:hypothetical protein